MSQESRDWELKSTLLALPTLSLVMLMMLMLMMMLKMKIVRGRMIMMWMTMTMIFIFLWKYKWWSGRPFRWRALLAVWPDKTSRTVQCPTQLLQTYNFINTVLPKGVWKILLCNGVKLWETCFWHIKLRLVIFVNVSLLKWKPKNRHSFFSV